MSHEQATAHDDIHALGSAGRFHVWFDNRSAGHVFLTSPSHRHWRFHIEPDAVISSLDELLAQFDYQLSADELRLVVSAFQSCEDWLETCPYDLAKFGEVGVSY